MREIVVGAIISGSILAACGGSDDSARLEARILELEQQLAAASTSTSGAPVTVADTSTTTIPPTSTTIVRGVAESDAELVADLEALFHEIFGEDDVYRVEGGPVFDARFADFTEEIRTIEGRDLDDFMLRRSAKIVFSSQVGLEGEERTLFGTVEQQLAIDEADRKREAEYDAAALKRELTADQRERLPGFPGEAFLEKGDKIVRFQLGVIPRDQTVTGDGLLSTFAIVSNTGVVKYNYFIMIFMPEYLIDYWSDL